jgi:hypothetical protein
MSQYIVVIAGVILALIIPLAIYGRATVKVVKDVGIVNPLTISLAVILFIAIIIELAK